MKSMTGVKLEQDSLTDNTKFDVQSMDFVMKSLLAGGIAGICAKTTVAPLDRMKILLQAHNQHYKNLGVISCLQSIVKTESFYALYKGNGAQMLRIFPYAATQFTSFELYKKQLGKLFGPKSQIHKFCAGSLAGVTAVTLTYPLDMIRARLAFQVSGHHIYKGIRHAAITILQKEGGVKALYIGFVPTVMGMIPYAGLSFYCFETLKWLCVVYLPGYCTTPHSQSTGGLVLTLPSKLACGAFAGAIAQSVAYPLDVTRRRMQLSMMTPDTHKFSKGCISTLLLILREDGIIKGLYRGMSINYLRAVPMVSVSFSTYELGKQILELDTGIEH